LKNILFLKRYQYETEWNGLDWNGMERNDMKRNEMSGQEKANVNKIIK